MRNVFDKSIALIVPLVFALLMTATTPLKAQSASWIQDTTGGMTPLPNYCPSTDPNNCKTSLFEAQNHIRAGTPNVGHLLYLVRNERHKRRQGDANLPCEAATSAGVSGSNVQA